jgi:YVTN family beta-propeller protein
MKSTFYPLIVAAALSLLGAMGLASGAPTGAATPNVTASPFDAAIVNNSLAVSPDGRIAAASDSRISGVRIYDLQSGRLLRTLAGFVSPRNNLFTPDGNMLLISDSTLGEVVMFETHTWHQIGAIAIGAGAFGTAVDRQGEKLYVNNEAANTVTVVDLPSRRTLAVLTGFSQPRQGIKLNPAGTRLYVTNFLGDKISVVEVASLNTIAEITGFKGVRALSLTADGITLYVANSAENTIAVVDLRTDQIVASIPVGKDPYGVVLSSDESHLYSGDKIDNTLTIIDTAKRTVVGKIIGFHEPRQAIVLRPDGTQAYVLNNDLSIAAVDLRTGTIVREIGKLL